MASVTRLDNGNLLVPFATHPKGKHIHGQEEIGPDHPDFFGWMRIWALENGLPEPEPPEGSTI